MSVVDELSRQAQASKLLWYAGLFRTNEKLKHHSHTTLAGAASSRRKNQVLDIFGLLDGDSNGFEGSGEINMILDGLYQNNVDVTDVDLEWALSTNASQLVMGISVLIVSYLETSGAPKNNLSGVGTTT